MQQAYHLFVSVNKINEKVSGNVDWLRNSSLNGGDVLNSGEILTFDLPKLTVMIKAPKLFNITLY